MNLTQASAVVTGGASGLGLATVIALIDRGVPTTIVDLESSAGVEVAEKLGDLATFSPSDVRDPEGVDRALDIATSKAPLRALVHCAGRGGTVRLVNKDGSAGDYDLYREIVDINLAGTFNVLRLAAARMAANEPVDGERGVCVLTASVAAWEGQIGQIPYASAKAGVVGMTLVAARDLSPRADPRLLDRARHLRHPDPEPVLRRDPGRARRPGPAPGAHGPTGGVRLDRAAHHRQPDAQRRDHPPRRRDPDVAAVTSPSRPRRHWSSPTSSTGSWSSPINRPEARNAINTVTAEAIGAAMDRLDEDPTLVAGVITGAGGTFCAGMDLKAFLAGEKPSIPGRGFAGIVEGPPAKPMIAAVEGYALAGGFEIALACDMIVAAEDAKFGLPEVKRGLVAAGGGLMRLPERVPYHLAMEWSLTGELVPATRALRGRPGQPAHAEGRRPRGRARARPGHLRQRPARRPGDQAGHRRGARVDAAPRCSTSSARSPCRSASPRTPARAPRPSRRSARHAGRPAEVGEKSEVSCGLGLAKGPGGVNIAPRQPSLS